MDKHKAWLNTFILLISIPNSASAQSPLFKQRDTNKVVKYAKDKQPLSAKATDLNLHKPQSVHFWQAYSVSSLGHEGNEKLASDPQMVMNQSVRPQQERKDVEDVQ